MSTVAESAAHPRSDRVGLADTHCHLTDRAFADDLDEVVARARAAGVTHIVAVGGGGPIEASEAAAALAERFPFIRATAGIHPHDASSYDDAIEARIVALLEAGRVVAVGETGLDYYYDNSPRDVQRSALARHIALARKHRVPIVLHCRDAESDLREVLASEARLPIDGVVHCFTGSYEDARWYLDAGLAISFTGILSFKKADELREVARRVPLDRMLLETDSPYLAPVPYRGKRNEPAYVAHVAKVVADLHATGVEHVAATTGAAAERLFFQRAGFTQASQRP
jgi:TatD DNase family protein